MRILHVFYAIPVLNFIEILKRINLIKIEHYLNYEYSIWSSDNSRLFKFSYSFCRKLFHSNIIGNRCFFFIIYCFI